MLSQSIRRSHFAASKHLTGCQGTRRRVVKEDPGKRNSIYFTMEKQEGKCFASCCFLILWRILFSITQNVSVCTVVGSLDDDESVIPGTRNKKKEPSLFSVDLRIRSGSSFSRNILLGNERYFTAASVTSAAANTKTSTCTHGSN